jgi:pimeloyl-ACP methyl ester carboxylesterase/predicted glycosyltransferase
VRAREPDAVGFALRDGVRIAYEIHGSGEPALLFLPAWSIVHSRMWKAQVPYFARRARVVTYDGRGNGLSDKAPELDYSDEAFAADVLAVMDAAQIERATLIALSAGARWALMTAARHPERVERLVCIAPAVPLGPANPQRTAALARFDDVLPAYDGWEKFNRHYWHTHYRDFLEFFFSQALPEPHSTKPVEDCIGWGLETTPQTLAATIAAKSLSSEEAARLAAGVRCPVLVLHGDADRIVPLERGRAFAEATRGELIVLEGSGHLPQARDPIRINLAISDALESPRLKRWARGPRRPKRALFISSPIGLGHVRRDAAIAAELRKLHPELEIDWLAQHPVSDVLRARGERIHPAGAWLANESAHFESECAEHDLHAFEAIRRMDEILVGNFMVFYDVVRSQHYDLVVGDEAWDVDHFLHENPEEKRTAFAWLTDFVGWLPMPDGGEREVKLTSDYNAEMIEHVERFPRLRDRAIFVGDPDDVVPERFGPGLPPIREWTQAHYDFSGYITGFTPPTNGERAELRERFGYHPDETVCIATAGGSGVGAPLLRRIIASYPESKRRLPQLRMIVVAGPRIDPARLPAHDGLEIHAFVPELYRRLAACDIALVQGGLTTTMELTAARRPFIYFPLRHHFEQNFHVRHRLERYGAGRCLEYASATPEAISAALVAELAREPAYRPVCADGAAKAAALIAELV